MSKFLSLVYLQNYGSARGTRGEGRDHGSFTKAKISFVHKRSVRVGLPCDGMLLDIQCCPLEIFAIKKPYLFYFGIVA